MAIQFLDSSFSDTLHDSAKVIAPSEEKCDEILQSVLKTAGAQEPASYADAIQKVDRLAHSKRVYTLRRGVTSVMLAAALFLTIAVTRHLPTSQVEVIPEGGVPLAESAFTCTVAPTVANGAVAASGDDLNIPVMDRFDADENSVTIYFTDEGSGVAWESIYAQDNHGNKILPVEVNSEQHAAIFALPKEEIDVYIADIAGNQAKTVIRV